MGLFSFIGRAVKGVAKIAGGALKLGGALGLIPGGSLVGKLAGSILSAKQPMSTSQQKIQVLARFNPGVLRGKNMSVPIARATPYPGPQILQRSPVLPGGAVATLAGPVAASGTPPAQFGGARASGAKKKRKRRSASSRRSSTARSSKKRSGGRKLKFGSPAWRKKYMKKRR